jgi:hypothetical protein
MFWCSTYNTYINCEGGDLKLKAQLQDDERENQFRRKQKDAMDGGRGRENTMQKTVGNTSDSGAGREVVIWIELDGGLGKGFLHILLKEYIKLFFPMICVTGTGNGKSIFIIYSCTL